MGILDDAIREHLELKRQHGAGSDDLERLEQEAFGPATRPGDPEFPGTDADAEAEAAPAAAEQAGPETGRLDWFTEGETTVAPEAPPSSAEEGRAEQADLGDTADHPAPEPPSGEEPAVEETPASEAPATEEPASDEPPEAPEREIFDAEEIDFGDLDIDLDEPDEGASSASPPVVSPDDDEDDLELSLDEDPPPAEEPATAVQPSTEPPPAADDDAEDGDGEEPGDEEPRDDLLEETPDFLQDTPEGDRLWFEQGKPKDFDFEDD